MHHCRCTYAKWSCIFRLLEFSDRSYHLCRRQHAFVARWGLLVTSVDGVKKAIGEWLSFKGWDCRDVSSSWRFVSIISIMLSLKRISHWIVWPSVWCPGGSVGLYTSRFNDLLVSVSMGVSLQNAAQIVSTFRTAFLCLSLQHHMAFCISSYSAPPPTLGLLHRICLCFMTEVSGFWLKAT